MADKILFDDPWVQMREKDGYVYSHEVRCNGQIVAFLAIFDDPEGGEPKVVVRKEHCPAWTVGEDHTAMPCAFTGGVDDGESPEEAVVREAAEEAGINVNTAEMFFLKQLRSTKSSDTRYFLYVFNIKGPNDFQRQTAGDGSQSEKEAENIVLTFSEAVDQMVDPIGQAIMAQVLWAHLEGLASAGHARN